jgi:hypothetical protein
MKLYIEKTDRDHFYRQLRYGEKTVFRIAGIV